jgi:hypothetical protein
VLLVLVDAERMSVTSFDVDGLRRRLDVAEAHGGPEALTTIGEVVAECVELLMSLLDQAYADLAAAATAVEVAQSVGDRQAVTAARQRLREQTARSSQTVQQVQAALSQLLSGTVAAGDATVAVWRAAAASRMRQTSDLLAAFRIQ